MKPESYFAWKDKPTEVIGPEWRETAGETPRRRGVMGALSALGFCRRPRGNWIKGF